MNDKVADVRPESMSWLSQAIRTLIEEGQGNVPLVTLAALEDKVAFLVRKGERFEIEYVSRPPLDLESRFNSLDSFVEYFNSAAGMIFVNDSAVVADLNWGVHQKIIAHLPLTPAEEWTALEQLMRGISQKLLWRLLISDLHGCISPELLLRISSIRIKNDSMGQVQINASGLGAKEEREALLVQFPGSKVEETAEIPVEWTFTGRIFDCFSEEITVPLRLEMPMTDKGLMFYFHPRRIGQLKREMRDKLVLHLANKLPNSAVYDGSCPERKEEDLNYLNRFLAIKR